MQLLCCRTEQFVMDKPPVAKSFSPWKNAHTKLISKVKLHSFMRSE
jgi:hypothetical protein